MRTDLSRVVSICVVTGAGGFLGKQLVLELLFERPDARVVAMVRHDDEQQLLQWLKVRRAPVDLLEVVRGDLSVEDCGFDTDLVNRLSQGPTHFFHAAARYHLDRVDVELDAQVNVEGTKSVIRLAEKVGAISFAHVSTVQVAGNYHGTWTEAHLREAPSWPHNYAISKHRAELLVHESSIPSRGIFRLGVLVGDECTGNYFKVDGIYGIFRAIRSIDASVPRGIPLPVVGWGEIPLCPVDHAARAIVALASAQESGLRTFHIFEDNVLRADDIIRLLLGAAGRAETFELSWSGHLVQSLDDRAQHDTVLRQLIDDSIGLITGMGIPRSALRELYQPTQFNNQITSARLLELGISSPSFEDYVSRLWHGWLAHEGRSDQTRRRDFFEGKKVVMTGGSSGIGAELLRRMLDAGVNSVVVLGRHQERLAEVINGHREEHRVEHLAADLLDQASVEGAVDNLVARGRPIDILLLSAGHSINRRLSDMSDELTELQRMTQINFLAPIHLIRSSLPLLQAAEEPCVVTLSTVSTQIAIPGFGVYSATKAALDQAFAVLPAELSGRQVSFQTVRLPLVKTAMTDVNARLRDVPMLSVGKAAEMVLGSMVNGTSASGTLVGRLFEGLRFINPALSRALSSLGWRYYLRIPYFGRLIDGYLRSQKS